MIREAVILAGGKGTRLKDVVSDRPKPMALINGKPFLEYLIRYLASYNIEHIILATGFMHQMVEEHFGNSYCGIKITYTREGQPLRTGGGIANALKYTTQEHVLILNGDSFFQADLRVFAAFHLDTDSDLSIALKPMKNPDRYGTVTLDGDKVTAFHEKQHCQQGFINTGVYILRKNTLFQLHLPEKFSFEKDFMEPFANRLRFNGFQAEGYFLDIGLPKTYQLAQSQFKQLFNDP